MREYTRMSEYQLKISQDISSKLVDFAMTECKSLSDCDMMFNYYLANVKDMYREHIKHYSKIMVVAYNMTIREMSK